MARKQKKKKISFWSIHFRQFLFKSVFSFAPNVRGNERIFHASIASYTKPNLQAPMYGLQLNAWRARILQLTSQPPPSHPTPPRRRLHLFRQVGNRCMYYVFTGYPGCLKTFPFFFQRFKISQIRIFSVYALGHHIYVMGCFPFTKFWVSLQEHK